MTVFWVDFSFIENFIQFIVGNYNKENNIMKNNTLCTNRNKKEGGFH